MGEWVDRETTAVFKGVVEREYFTRLVYEEIVGAMVVEVVNLEYEEEEVVEGVATEMVEGMVQETARESLRKVREV